MGARLLAAPAGAILLAGCLGYPALNSAGEPVGRPAHVTSVCVCPRCLRPGGEGHRCDVTSYCEKCSADHGAGHVCGKTRYCPVCRRDVEIPHAHAAP